VGAAADPAYGADLRQKARPLKDPEAPKAVAGTLAIWHDLEDSVADLYEEWLVGEHIPERLALPGFLEARRYESVMGSPRYFIAYSVATPEALASPEYLARLASPTPMTREAMKGFRHMMRTACSVAYRSPGRGLGGCVIAAYAESPAAISEAALLRQAVALERDPRVVGVQVWKAAKGAAAAPSSEAKLRPGGDRGVEAALVVDVLREDDGAALEETVRAALRQSIKSALDDIHTHIDTYRLLGVWRNGP
jgi:hypothetical protein